MKPKRFKPDMMHICSLTASGTGQLNSLNITACIFKTDDIEDISIRGRSSNKIHYVKRITDTAKHIMPHPPNPHGWMHFICKNEILSMMIHQEQTWWFHPPSLIRYFSFRDLFRYFRMFFKIASDSFLNIGIGVHSHPRLVKVMICKD